MARHICIDFEGEGRGRDGTTPQPSLLGAWIPRNDRGQGDYHLWLLEPELAPIAKGSGFPRGGERRCTSFEECIDSLVERAETLDCRLVAYSDHERAMVREHLTESPALVNAFEHRHFNVLPKARRLARKRGWCGDSARLVEILNCLRPKQKWPPPPAIGVANACRRLRAAGRRSTRWRSWTDKEKELARELIRYNQGDCVAVRRLVNIVGAHLGELS